MEVIFGEFRINLFGDTKPEGTPITVNGRTVTADSPEYAAVTMEYMDFLKNFPSGNLGK